MTSDSADIDGYAGVVCYELKEVVHLLGWIKRPHRLPMADQTLRNALLEAFLGHARCLLEFLLNSKDTIQASDFAPGWDLSDRAKLGTSYRSICNYLSHMSKGRVGSEQPKWPVDDIVDEILTGLEDLIGDLGSEPHEVKLREHISWARAVHTTGISTLPSAVCSTTSSTTMILGSTGLPPSTTS